MLLFEHIFSKVNIGILNFLLYGHTLFATERRVIEQLLQIPFPSLSALRLALLVYVACLDIRLALRLHYLVKSCLGVADDTTARLFVGLVGVGSKSLLQSLYVTLILLLADEFLIVKVVE